MKEPTKDEISLCNSCNCMTHDIKANVKRRIIICGKCKSEKRQDCSPSEDTESELIAEFMKVFWDFPKFSTAGDVKQAARNLWKAGRENGLSVNFDEHCELITKLSLDIQQLKDKFEEAQQKMTSAIKNDLEDSWLFDLSKCKTIGCSTDLEQRWENFWKKHLSETEVKPR